MQALGINIGYLLIQIIVIGIMLGTVVGVMLLAIRKIDQYYQSKQKDN